MFKSIGLSMILGFSTQALAQTSMQPPASTMAQPPAAAPLLSDEQIAQVLLTINQGEIEAGQLASRSAKSKEVRSFATDMVEAHKKNVAETKILLKKMKVKASDSDLSKSLVEEAKASKSELKAAGQTGFDKSYLQQQVAMHEKALSTLNTTLIPNAKNADLRAHLEKTRTAVSAHLDHAKSLTSTVTQ